MARARYVLQIAGVEAPLEGTTDDLGQIELPVGRATRQASLTVYPPPPPREESGGAVVGESPTTFDLDVGSLAPIQEPAPDDACVTGVQQRLQNLGFECGPATGEMTDATRAAIRAFRRAYGLADGDASDGELQRKRAEVHDSPGGAA